MKALFIGAGHGRSLYGLKKDNGAASRFGGAQYLERDICKELARRVLNIVQRIVTGKHFLR